MIIRHVLASLLISLISMYSYAQVSNDISFKFPIHPKDSVWNKLSVSERIQQLQMPDSVIYKISTEELLNVSLDFPYLFDIFFADNYQEGFESLVKEFNGFQELMTRADLLGVVFHKLVEMSLDLPGIEKLSNIERGNSSLKWFVLEMILAQDVMIDMINNDYLKLCIDNLNTKKKFSSFGKINEIPTYLLLAKKEQNSFLGTDKEETYRNFVSKPLRVDDDIRKELQQIIKRKAYEK